MTNKRPREDDLVTTTVSFDRETYRRLQHYAVDAGKSVRELVREAVDAYLRKVPR
jgi:hypothetical protein